VEATASYCYHTGCGKRPMTFKRSSKYDLVGAQGNRVIHFWGDGQRE